MDDYWTTNAGRKTKEKRKNFPENGTRAEKNDQKSEKGKRK